MPDTPATSTPPAALTSPSRAAVQRWRIKVARTRDAPDLDARELVAAWLRGLTDHEVPLAWSGGAKPRPRIAFGAALPVGIEARGELIEVSLTERWPIWRVRDAVLAAMPTGWQLVDLADVWIGAPAIAATVVAADYRISLRRADVPAGEPDDPDLDPSAVGDACAALIAATVLPRVRQKGGSTVPYDLRPMVIDAHVDPASRARVTIAVRTRFHPERGTGRPEEVVAALGDMLDVPLEIDTLVRERLILAEELDERG